MQLSHWEHKHLREHRDVIIIGAGIVGLNTAIALSEAQSDWCITVLDKSIYGCAASTRNAGFACFGTVSEIISDRTEYGDQGIIDLISMRRRGLAQLLRRYGAETLGYIQCGGYEVFVDDESAARYYDKIDEVNELMGEDLFYKKEKPAVHRVSDYMIANDQEAYLNTDQLYATLVRDAHRHGIEIIRGITALQIDEGHIQANVAQEEVEMSASQVIITTNAHTKSILPDTKVHPVRNQVLITTPLIEHGLHGTYHMDRGYIYFRDIDDRILIGGARNHFSTEDTSEFGTNEANVQYLVKYLQRYFLSSADQARDPMSLVERSWSGILTGGANRLPIVQRLNAHQVMAVRLGGMGVAIGAEIGRQAAALTLD